MSSCSQSYLDGVFDPAATILCGSDAVMDPVTGRSSHPCHTILHNYLPPPIWTTIILFVVGVVGVSSSLYLSSLYLSSSSSSLYHPFLFLIISTLGNAIYPWRLCTYCCVHWEWRAQILICFGSHNNYSGSCGVPSDILGWQMARWARFSHNQGIAHPWSSYGGLKMLQ